jgi:hypothetical protein
MKTFSSIYSYTVFICIYLAASNAFGQHAPLLDSLRDKFNDYRTKTPQEKIYLHLDRTFLLTGEILWFKVYAVDGSLHNPVSPSKVVYVEILDKNNAAVLQAKIGMQAGTGHGSFFLNASLNSGTYQVRAYTNWMKNFSPDFYFHQTITIVNPFIEPVVEKTSPNTRYNAVFFPEGGNLVTGITSKVAFKVTDDAGESVRCTGAVINQQNDTIVQFKTLRNGIGNFYFRPSADQSYKAVIKCNGHTSTHKLPAAYAQGMVMQVSDSAEYIKVKVNSNTASTYLYLFIHTRQMVTHAAVETLHNNSTQVLIRKNVLADGISHITLFDGDLRPVCERLYFKYPDTKLVIDAKQDQPGYGMRSKVSIDLFTNVNGLPNRANLSVSVHKIDSIPVPAQQGISNFLWLTSDLTGTVDSLAYYFGDDKNSKIATDNLLLTHGWRRFKWEDVIEKKDPDLRHVLEYRGHIIRGKVTNNEDKAAPGIQTWLSTPDKVIRLYASTSNANGNVQFEAKDINGTRTLAIRAGNTIDSAYAVTLENPYSISQTSHSLPAFNLPSNLNTQLLKRSFAMQVQDIYHEDKRDRFVNAAIDSVNFYGKADGTYYLDDYTRFPMMEEVMREYVPGVNVRKRNGKFYFVVLDKLHNRYFDNDPLILLDGVPLFNADEIMAFDPRKIKKLEVFTRKYYLGSTLIEGMVSYSTYHGDLAGMSLNPKLVTIDYEALQLHREFYSPDYSNEKKLESRIPDHRNLLYWTPEGCTGKDGKYKLEFYTSDIKGTYTVYIEGLTPDGIPGSAAYTFTVR